MKRNLTARLTALLLAALFVLAQLVPASTAQAQRRRRRASRPAPARRSNPQAPQRPTAPAPRAETPTPSAPARRAGKETTFESLLAADAYGIFVEVRKIGQLSQNADLKTALAALRLSGEMPKDVADLLGFLNQHAEALGEARYVLTMMPATPGLPISLSALEFPTVEAAAAFEPKYRALVSEQMKAYKKANSAPAPGVPKMPEINLDIRRVGNVMLLGTERFTLKQLRGDGTGLLSESVRFQTMRGRFASESLFVYVDTGAIQRGWAVQMELIKKQAEEAQEAAQAAEANEPAVGITHDVMTPSNVVIEGAGAGTREGTLTTETAVVPLETPASATGEPEEGEGEGEGEEGEMTPELTAEEIAANKAEEAAAQPPKPSEEQVAVSQFTTLLRGWERGSPRIPETFAVAVALEGGTVVARAAVANTPDGAVNLIPFLPNVFNGPPVSSESATVAPGDTDVFFSTSLEWSRIFNGLLGAADERAASIQAAMGENPEAGLGELGEDGKPLMAGAVVETIEKLFGFKFKEDLLPSLGSEVAFSVPLSFFTSNMMSDLAKKEQIEKEQAEKAARPGFVVLVALTDADKVRKILPRVAVAFGMASPETPPQTERREGFDIQSLGSFSYVIINNHLAIAEDVRAVRHVVDSFSRRQTLDASSRFRDATAWQAKQRVAQVFVADSLMKYAQDDAKKTASVSTDPIVAALTSQLDATPEPAAYAATNEGDALLHEVRLPLSLIKTYAASIMISAKEAPIRSNESMARYALTAIVGAQERFKVEKQMQRYGTLEELMKEDLVEKWVFERQEYKIELTVVGDKFEATAVPANYGKTGRRSFFVDESGVVRAADHQGKPATLEDPPVDGEQ